MELVFNESDCPLSGAESHTQNDSRIVRTITLYIMFTWQQFFSNFRHWNGGAVSTFLTLLVTLFGLSTLSEFVKQLPKSFIQARKYIGHNRDDFTRYVSCPKCHYIYDIDICTIRMPDRTIQSRKCTFVKFPNHPQRVHRMKKCDTVLMKPVKRNNCSLSTPTFLLQEYYQHCKVSWNNVSFGEIGKLQKIPYVMYMMEGCGKNS